MLLKQLGAGNSFWADVKLIPELSGGIFSLLASSFFINILSLALPLTLMQVYDRIVPTQGRSTLAWLAIGFFTALALETCLRFCRSTCSNWTAARFEYLASCDAIERILASRIEEFERWGVGEHLDRLNSINTLKSFYSGQALQLIMDLPFAVIFLVVLGYIGGMWMVVFPMALLALFAVLCYFCRASYFKHRDSQLAAGFRRYNFIIEALSGIHTVKALTLEEQMLRRYERLQESAAKANMGATVFSVLAPNLGALFSQIMLFGMLLLGGLNVIDGTLTMGAMAACSLLGGRLFQPFQGALAFWVRYSDLELARKRLQSLVALKPAVAQDAKPAPREIAGAVRLENVSFRFDERSPFLLESLSVYIPAKSFVGIKSSEASASTAMLYLMTGLYTPQSGAAFLDGTDLSLVDHSDLKGRVEYLPQAGTLFNASIFDNISMGEKLNQEASKDAGTLVGLDELTAQLPQGYETRVGNRLYEFLPSGVVQRICLARALVVRPRVMLFDRFDTSLDSESERVLLWLLGKLKGTCTIIFVTVDQTILDMADVVYEIDNARLRTVRETPAASAPVVQLRPVPLSFGGKSS